MIEVSNLTKQYGKNTILNNVSVRFKEGMIYGLVGPNGCGKTTLMRCICGFTRPTHGVIKVAGKLVGKDCDFAPSTGIIIETPGFISCYTAYQNLRLLSPRHGGRSREDLEELIRSVGLNPREQKKVGDYSLGMRQRLGIAQAIMDDPHHLILDEPFNGLDKQGVQEIHELLQWLKRQGRVIILASHSQSEIAFSCDEVLEFEKGKIQEKTVQEWTA